jgi:hypothetical protein
MWTVTTDPGVLDVDIAIRTISRRWHNVLRELIRHYPNIHYFRVLEFTQSGLPHMHVLFDRYVDWHLFRRVLIYNKFGRVLNFIQVPRSVGFSYLTKYITKSIEQNYQARTLHLRSWSASFHFLPILKYFSDGTEFDLVWYGHVEYDLPRMLHDMLLHATDNDPTGNLDFLKPPDEPLPE